MIALRGNHDQYLIDFLEDGTEASDWLDYGGATTLLSSRLEDVIYVPIEAVKIDGDARTCTVVGALGGASARRVVTGRTTASFVEIVRGLSPGEVVRLEP